MSFRLVLTLSLAGLLVGLGTVFGLVHSGIESIVWCGLAIVFAFVIAARAPSRPFLHGFLVGLIAGVRCELLQAAFLDRSLARNPKAADSFTRLPQGMSPRLLLVVSAPIIGGLYGVVIGFFAWIASKLIRRRTPAAVAPAPVSPVDPEAPRG